jgi:hypothetical protein
MSADGVSDVPAANPDNVAHRPASNLLLAGTGLSLALAVSAAVGFSPTVSGPASPPGASQIPTDRVAVDLAAPETSPLAADRTGVGGVTIDQVSAPSAAPPPIALGAANSGSLPAGGPSAAAAPQPPRVSFAPAEWRSPIAASDPTEPDSSTGPVNASDTVTGAFGDGGTELGNAPSPARPGAAGPGIGAGGGVAKAGNSTGGAAGGGGSNESDGNSNAAGSSSDGGGGAAKAGNGTGGTAGGGNESDGNANAGSAAGSGGDNSGDSDGQGDQGGGQGGHGGHGGHHGH